MTRRIVRAGIQFGILSLIVLIVVYFLDIRYRVLPQSIHSHLPSHHAGLVITDIKVQFCFTPLSRCKLDPGKWHRVEKNLYLNSGFFSNAYLHVKRKREEDLGTNDKVVVDLKIGKLDPANGHPGEANAKWESREAGIWIKRSTKKHDSDSKNVVTAIDILFGADAVEPRHGWEIRDHALLLGSAAEAMEARVSLRRGAPQKNRKPQLRVNDHGKFKIIQISDLHLSTGTGKCRDPEPKETGGEKCEADPRTLEFIARVLDSEKPNMAVLSGDQINGKTAPDVQTAVYKFADLFIKREIPFATIYGNHDDEGPLSRLATMSLTQALPFSLSEPGPENIDGVGNYYVEVFAPKSSKHSAMTIYFMDTHSYSPDERRFSGYDWVKPNQINWFNDTASRNRENHKSQHYSHFRMDMAFIHIPLPEYVDVANNLYYGKYVEPSTAPGFNTHLYDALVEAGIHAVSCGHDHVNEFCALRCSQAEDKGVDDCPPEMWLCHAGGSGFGGYGGWGEYHRRVRIFEMDFHQGRMQTWKRLEYGDTEARVDEQFIVDQGLVTRGDATLTRLASAPGT